MTGYFLYYILGIILIPAIILSIWAEAKVHSTYEKYYNVPNNRNLTGKDVAEMILRAAEINDVIISGIDGKLTDHYDPKNKVLAISNKNLTSTSVSAIGVVAHECGHAIQHQEKYIPIIIRNIFVKLNNITSKLLIPLLILGAILDAFLYVQNSFITIAIIGISIFGLSFLLNLITLPIEKNASKRALKILKESTILNEEEIIGAEKVLNAAAMTYLSAVLYSLLNFLRFILVIVVNNKRD